MAKLKTRDVVTGADRAGLAAAGVTPEPGHGVWRVAGWVAIVCVLLSAAVFTQRGVEAWRIAGIAPGTAETSGFEQETFFTLWRAVHGQPVFTDSTRIPFGSAYFNWLFYSGYGLPVHIAVASQGDAVIPRAARLVTAGGALVGAFLLSLWFARMAREHWALAAALGTFVFFGPLVGWWGHTARPDVWALAFETAGLAAFALLHRRRPTAAILTALLCFYAAWACKPTFVAALGTTIVFLAWRRQWRWALVLVAGSAMSWGLTLAVLGESYRSALQATATTNVFAWSTGMANFRDAASKIAPLLLLAGFLALRSQLRKDECLLRQDAKVLGVIGVLVSLALAFPASCKVGAASNYYFTCSVMLALVGFSAAPRFRSAVPVLSFCAVVALYQLLCLTGTVGRINLSPRAEELAARWHLWQQQPEPRFSADLRLNLPWLGRGSPPLVLGFNYWLERAAGRSFEAGGVGGMVEDGVFASLLLPAATKDRFDSGNLLRYRAGATVRGMTLFRRVADPSPNP